MENEKKVVILPLWFGPGGNVDCAEGWDSCLNEVMERLEAAGVPFEMEKKFGEGRVEKY